MSQGCFPRQVGLLLVAVLGIITQCDAAITIAPSLPKATISPGYTITTPVLTVIQPMISRIDQACIKPGSKFTIKGQNFGTATGKKVLMQGNSLHTALAVLYWQDTSIIVNAPNSGQLHDGAKYSLTIENDTLTKSLSNQYAGLTVCKATTKTMQPMISTTTKSVLPSLIPSISTLPSTSTQTPTTSQQTNSINENPVGSGSGFGIATTQNDSGSLSNVKLPDPPQIPTEQAATNMDIEPREVLLISESMQEAEQLRRTLSGMGVQVIRRSALKGIGLVISVLRLPDGVSVKDGLTQLRQQFKNVWMDSNNLYQMQGGHGYTDPKQFGTELIRWPHRGYCTGTIRVGIIDSEVDIHHPALQHQDILQKSFLSSGIKPSSMEHGTAIAALLVGYDPAQHIRGLLNHAKVFVAGVFRQQQDRHVDTTTELIVRGLDWLVAQHVSTINFSLGGNRNLVLEAAIHRALSSGIAIIASAGNSGPNAPAVYPAAQAGVVAVTALDADRHIYNQSNQGNYIAISAPGVDVWSAAPASAGRYYSGTSYAAPYVTAYFALRGKQSIPDFRKQMQRQALDLGSKGKDKVYGWGLLQAENLCRTR
jgi:hypothetical protein